MDFKNNFSPFQFEAQKLEAATAKGFADNYKQASQSYINQLCKIDNEVLKKDAQRILFYTKGIRYD